MRINSNIAFSPNGRRLAIVCGGNEIFVWDVPKLQLAAGASPVRITAPHLTLQNRKEILGLAFTADGRELQGLDVGTSLVTWNANARDDSGFGPDAMEGGSYAKISADVTKVAFNKVFPNPVCRVWDLVTNRELFQLKSAGTFDSFCFSPDGRCAALVWNARSSQQQSQIVIHDAQTGEKLKTIQVDQPDSSIPSIIVAPVFRPDGEQIAALSIPPRLQVGRKGVTRLVAWDASTGKQLFSVEINAAENDAPDYTPDGTSLVMATRDRLHSAAVYYDASTGERQRSIPLPSTGRSYFVHAPNEIFGSYGSSEADAIFGDLASGKEQLRVAGYNGASCFAISPDGSRLFLGKNSYSLGESELTLWSLKYGTRLLALKRRGRVSAVSFSPDGNRLVAVFLQSGPGPLKPIQIWDATRQVIARFEAERQALAMMDHPNIARVLDAGETENGRPYFVMELVKGIPIIEFCDTKRLGMRERLKLFLPVCQAIQHAHQKGIIHRDIKPSNVLVALYDGHPVPKVIDFGVAKATGQKLTEKTMFTEYGQILGTLEYMSPEQAELNQLDIDTRTDIYSLGVLLYELITGTTPLDRKRLRSAAFSEMLRMTHSAAPSKNESPPPNNNRYKLLIRTEI